MTGRLQGRVVLVTGGSVGIGRATALALAREGAKVVVVNRSRAGGQDTVRAITDLDGRVFG